MELSHYIAMLESRGEYEAVAVLSDSEPVSEAPAVPVCQVVEHKKAAEAARDYSCNESA